MLQKHNNPAALKSIQLTLFWNILLFVFFPKAISKDAGLSPHVYSFNLRAQTYLKGDSSICIIVLDKNEVNYRKVGRTY